MKAIAKPITGVYLSVPTARLAVERGWGRFEWSVLDWNELAIQFYKRLGAVPLNDATVFRLAGEALQKLTNDEEPIA